MDIRPSHPVVEVLAEAVLRTRMALDSHLPNSGVNMYASKMLQQREGEQLKIGGLQVCYRFAIANRHEGMKEALRLGLGGQQCSTGSVPGGNVPQGHRP